MKPILFNTEMVQAILDRRKRFTRRIANINTDITCNDGTTNHDFVLDNFNHCYRPTGFVCRKCGFGVAPPHSRDPVGTSRFRPRYFPGDILYVRETWRIQSAHRFEADARIEFRAGGQMTTIQFPGRCSDSHERNTYDEFISKWGVNGKWHPSIHMPKEAAQTFLRVKKVSVERLNDMLEEDAIAEGFPDLGVDADSPLERFAVLWDKTIKRDQIEKFGWYANPWTWVIEYERISKEEAVKEDAKC